MFNTPEEIFYSVIAGVALVLFLVIVIVFSIIRYQQRVEKFRREKLDLHSQFSKTLMETQLEIKEQTLQNLSHELHDNLGQIASLIKIYLNTININETNQSKIKIEDTKNLVRQLITDLKMLSISLNSERVSQLGIVVGLESEIERINRIDGIQAKFLHIGQDPIFDSDNITILYRMIQETLNNSIKHSSATTIDVTLEVTENLTILIIKDNGKGFNYNEALKKGGAGLINLKNRANLINAKFMVKTSLEGGTKVVIEIPN